MYDAIIVGGGPAGLSAALILGRCGYKVLVFDSGQHRNAPSHAMHGFLSRDGFPPIELLRIGREQLQPYGVEIRSKEVADVQREQDGFSVTSCDGDIVHSRKLLLATGIIDNLPQIEEFHAFYGHTAFHCPYCDGWENRDKKIVAYAQGKEAATYALTLRGYTADLVLCSDGPAEFGAAARERLARNQIELIETPVTRFEGVNQQFQRVIFADGRVLQREVLFFHLGQKQRSGLARKLGCAVSNEEGAQANENTQTTIPGLYIAGDATRDVQQVSVAAAEGVKAAFAINEALREEKFP